MPHRPTRLPAPFAQLGALWARLHGRNTVRLPDKNTQAPLLSPEERAELWSLADTLPPLAPPNRLSARARQGDQSSARIGNGTDFEQLRPWQTGDNSRHVDWRASARLGKLHVRTWRETRQGRCHLFVDRGASMRFGSRERLKVTQAARMAALLAIAAWRQGLTVSASVLDEAEGRFIEARNRAELLELIDTLCAPCPPGAGLMPTHWQPALDALDARIEAGARLILFGDGLGPGAGAYQRLAQMARHHALTAILIHDPLEQLLPEMGTVRVTDLHSAEEHIIDTRDAMQRAAYGEATAARHRIWTERFTAMGVETLAFSTEASLDQLPLQLIFGSARP